MMKNQYMEILFALYMNGSTSTMAWLTDFMMDGSGSDREKAREVKQRIGTLASAGLLRLSMRDDKVFVSLTDAGIRAALTAAEVISEQMMDEWQQATA